MQELLEKYLSNKNRITMNEISSECLNIKTKGQMIIVGKMLKKIGWNRYQTKNGDRYYRKDGSDVMVSLVK